MFNTNLRRWTATAVLTVIAVGAMAGLLVAHETANSKLAGDTMAAYFKIGNRPTVITVEEIEKRIANFPDFGEKAVTALKAAAPIDNVTKLDSLKSAKGRDLLNSKQLVLLLTFYNLKP